MRIWYRMKLCWVVLLPAINTISQPVIDRYISQGLQQNLVLQKKEVALETGMVALKSARSLFLPTTWFEGQYTLAKGGRSIDIPVGDLVNPIYKTLNQLTNSNGFTSINNVSEQLLPNNFYDVRIKTTMPLINPDIKYNRNIKEQEMLLQENEIDTYKRELVLQIKTAYYNYLVTTKAIGIYESALTVVNQNLRINQSLLTNGKGLPAYVSRAASEVQKVQSQLVDATNQQQNARAYFNFLLNRDLADSIEVDEKEIALPALDQLPLTDNINGREELKGLLIARNINHQVLKMNTLYARPRVNLFFDLASQAFDFKVKRSSFFYFGGLQVNIPIYSGKRNLYKIDQAKLEGKSIELSKDNTAKQLELAAFVSRNNVTTAYHNYIAAARQLEAAQKYFKLINRGYQEGVNNFIEVLDARNEFTNAQLSVNINHYKFLNTLADHERQTSAYTFNP